MNLDLKTKGGFFSPELTRVRVILALTIAVCADLLQIILVPLTWTFVQAAIDLVAMVLVLPVLGFHLLLLPTFIIEFMPGVDMLPTWTGCVIAVIALKKRAAAPTPPADLPPVIDVTAVNPSGRQDKSPEPNE